jgi:hypothetical protein
MKFEQVETETTEKTSISRQGLLSEAELRKEMSNQVFKK